MTNLIKKIGIGLESEGFIMDEADHPRVLIDGIPSSEYIHNEISRLWPNDLWKIGFEQASVILETRTAVHENLDEAIAEIFDIRAMINQVLKNHGLQLKFQPVSEHDFDFIPATTDPNSRTHYLIDHWGKSEDGLKKLISTATACLQVNSSIPFANIKDEEEKLEISRELFNSFSAPGVMEDFLAMNSGQKSFMDMTRQEHATYLLTGEKAEQFQRRGFPNKDEIIFPAHFSTVAEMQKWMCAHSDVDTFAEANPKNEHAFTCKIKRGDQWVVETRFSDAVDSEEEMRKVVLSITQHLEAINITT